LNIVFFYKKISYILDKQQKAKVVFLLFLLIIGMLLEALSTGLVLPLLSYINNPDFLNKYHYFQDILVRYNINSNNQVLVLLLSMFAIANMIKFLFFLYLYFLQSSVTYSLQSTVSQRLFETYLRQPYVFFLNRNSAFLLQNTTSEVNTITTMTNQFMVLVTDLCMLVSILVLLIVVDPFTAVFSFGIFGVFSWIFFRISRYYNKKWGIDRQKHEGLGVKHLQQAFGGIKDIKILNTEDFFLGRFRYHRDKTAHVNQRQMFVSQLPKLWLEFLTILALAFIIALQLLQGKSIAYLIPIIGLFITAAFRIMPSMNRIITSLQVLSFSIPAVDVVYNELQHEKNTKRKSIIEQEFGFQKSLRIEHVFFKYAGEGRNILDDLSIEIPCGTTVGLIGHSGEGKSTLIDILLGLLEPTKGRIMVDFNDIHADPLRWQKKIGYVPQTIFLTDDTIRRNIAFGLSDKDIDEERVKTALRLSRLEEYLNSLPEGLNTLVGERGLRLSGGQRQRIGIARALYNDPQVLVLDEATSSLDIETERHVMEAIAGLRGKKTIIIATHRLSTVKNVDFLYLVKKGKLFLQTESDFSFEQ
jgi:ABC-type multidrug transport system fused ATPase/permease subunit